MADTLDILTIEEARAAVGLSVTDVSQDTPLARYNTAAARLLDQRVGPTVARTATESYNGGRCYIRLRQRPAKAITSITEYAGGPTGVVLSAITAGSQAANGYYPEPYRPDPTLFSGKVVRRSGVADYVFPYGRANVVVVYSAGRYSATTACDARFKHAASICLENLWRDREQTAGSFGEFDVPRVSFPTFALPKAVADLLTDELYYQRPMRAG